MTEQSVLIRFCPSARGPYAASTFVSSTMPLSATIRYAQTAFLVALPTLTAHGRTHTFAGIWVGDEVTVDVGPLRMVLCLPPEGE